MRLRYLIEGNNPQGVTDFDKYEAYPSKVNSNRFFSIFRYVNDDQTEIRNGNRNSQIVLNRWQLYIVLYLLVNGFPYGTFFGVNIENNSLDFVNFIEEKFWTELRDASSATKILEHTNVIRSHLAMRNKVFIVSHSLETVYANSIYDALTDKEKLSVGMVFTAPAVGEINGDSANVNYLSADNDNIVPILRNFASRLGIDTPLPANQVTNPSQSGDWNHGLNGYVGRYGMRIWTIVEEV